MVIAAPRFAVNSYCTPHNSVFDDIEQVARIGGQGVGLWEGKFASRDGGIDDRIAAAMAERELGTSCAVPAMHAILAIPFGDPGPTDLQERVDLICASIGRLARFRPQVLAVAPGTSGRRRGARGPVEDVIRALPQIADTAAEHGVQVGVELLAERRGSVISTIPDMIAVLDEVNRPNLGIMLDVFHNWCEPDVHERMRRYADRINSVQVCDIKFGERGGFDREYPGRGRGAAVEFVATMIEVGYTGFWELEVFSDDGTYGNAYPDSYWVQPHEQFLAEAKKAFDETWAAAVERVESRHVTA